MRKKGSVGENEISRRRAKKCAEEADAFVQRFASLSAASMENTYRE